MSRYPKILLVKSAEKYDWFELAEDCEFEHEEVKLVIPKGFTTDFASVPQVFWWLIPPHCNAAMPSVIHDYTCEFGILPRWKCDSLFLKLLKQTKIKLWQYILMYLYVRALGWVRYNRT